MTKSSRPLWATGGPITIIKMYFCVLCPSLRCFVFLQSVCPCVFQMLAASQVRDRQVFLVFSAACFHGCSVGSSLILLSCGSESVCEASWRGPPHTQPLLGTPWCFRFFVLVLPCKRPRGESTWLPCSDCRGRKLHQHGSAPKVTTKNSSR